jgi:hypothetical protein
VELPHPLSHIPAATISEHAASFKLRTFMNDLSPKNARPSPANPAFYFSMPICSVPVA